MEGKDRIIVALDVDSIEKAIALVKELVPHVGYFKVGLELLTSEGAPKVVQAIKEAGGKIFYDGKFKDIPNTVAGAVRAAVRLGVDMLNVHCLGGSEMMKTTKKVAVEEAKSRNVTRPLLLGVTVLTSLDYEDLAEMGIFEKLNIADPKEAAEIKEKRIKQLVQNLAYLAQEAGLDGVIASPKEIQAIREYCQPEFLIVTPGVRPEWATKGDQKRVMTPYEAILAGADYLVIGRPITQPPPEIGTPVEAAKKIAEEIERALIEKILIEKNAIWTFKVMPNEPHALLASGKHSDGYINLNAVLQSPQLCETLAKKLVSKLMNHGITKEHVDVVVSSSFAAITLGHEVARQLGVDFVFTEKEGEEQKWSGRFEIPQGSRILQVEELITTLSTTEKVKKAILEKNPGVKFLEIDGKTVVAAIVHRPDHLPIDYPHYKVIALIEKEIHNWDPEKCPLCQKGLEALKPKQNWQRFIEHR